MTFHLMIVYGATTAAGYLMMASGIFKRLLDRPRGRVCPTCGRDITQRVCGFCGSNGRS